MKYQLKMSSKDTYVITEKEAKELMLGNKKGLIGINSLQGVINMSFVESIIPENKIDKTKTNDGFLHDGTPVFKQYGIWKDKNNPNITLDQKYYPELTKDEVYSENPKNNLVTKTEN